ncbi:hypothetical protein M9H77_01583 [Catharanthus roseus]|uniref:Uncharacterized protein n=1 Tax=Catharanthus roseus TaxID=4058 RepID=A0ACC0C5Z4_CATRO|nr:hypothetical protein M9H77_01583 [Catharanthus roseus]
MNPSSRTPRRFKSPPQAQAPHQQDAGTQVLITWEVFIVSRAARVNSPIGNYVMEILQYLSCGGNFILETAVNDMGHWFSRLELESELLDGFTPSYEVVGSSTPKRPLSYLDHEIAQLTKLRSGPHENFSRVLPGQREASVSTVKMLMGREANYSGRGRFSASDRCHILSKYLPVNGPWVVDQMNTRAYISQFSADGSLCVAAFQGSHIRIYNVERGWKVQKNIIAKSLRWTVTDTSLSPDQRHLVYATMSPIIHVVNVDSAATESLANITEIHEGYDLSIEDDNGYSFGIFSVKFSTDGREIVAGSSDDSIYVQDLEANRLSLRILAHTSDVNSVCFADESGHIIYSGSDDNLCKVWDRRCFRTKGKPAGVLIGHLEGITFLDSRGDGRYLISNGKDQTIKLWDIRKMSSNEPRYVRFHTLHSFFPTCSYTCT